MKAGESSLHSFIRGVCIIKFKKIQLLRIKFKPTKSKQFRTEFNAFELNLTGNNRWDLSSPELLSRDGRGVSTKKESTVIYFILQTLI